MKSIYKKIINLVFKIIYGQIYINNDIFKNISLKKIRLKSKYSSFLYIINECRVFTDCNTNVAYIKKNVIIPDISYQQNGNKIADINFNSTLKNGTPKLKKNFNGVVMSLVQGSSGSNYYHWFYDIIPKLEILHQNNYLKKVNFFYLPDVNNFILESLKLYGINKKQLINSKEYKHIYANKVLALEHIYLKKGTIASGLERVPKWIPVLLNKKFLKYKKKIRCSKKIFIDRSDSKFIHFSIINKKNIESFFKKKGFKFYKLSKLTLYETIFLFNNAKIIVGSHGAGFANIAFCKKNTKIYEILPFNESKRNVYKNIGSLLGMKHCKIITRADKNFQIYLEIKSIKNLFK